MIDTIVITLSEDSFTINDHDRFSPSTEGLYANYYRLGGRSNLSCVQNPTITELRAGNYKPRLTATKRLVKSCNYQVTLKVEFSAPKLIYGNNFDELRNDDFNLIISILRSKLLDMGVSVSEPILAHAPVSSIHYSKNIPLVDYTTPYFYLEKLSKINLNQRLDLNQTDFRNEGHSLKFRANSFEVVFYDKMKDLCKARTSEKRAEEKENVIQMKLFEKVEIQKPFEVLRMEVRLNKRQKLKQVLNKVGTPVEPTFESLFNKEIARKVLLHYMTEMEKGYPAILDYDFSDAKTLLSDIVIGKKKVGLKEALAILGLRTIIAEVGVREFREITKKYSKITWYRLNKEMKEISSVSGQQPFLAIRKCLEEFKPLKLIDFQKT